MLWIPNIYYILQYIYIYLFIYIYEWKREDCQNKWWNDVHQEEENEVDLNFPGR